MVGKLIAALVAAGVLVAGLLLPYVGGLGLAARHEASKFLNTQCNLTESPPPRKTTLYARDGKTVIATLFKEDRVPIPLTQVPDYLQAALIATEDRRFYEHHGVDMRGLIRSAIKTSNGDTQGGSTLTMQYVKQVRYYQAIKDGDQKAAEAAVDPNLQRKMEDAKCAIAIEKREGKNEILDNYLNIAFFGENSYGIQTAAETYFGKSAQDLSLPESAVLVGLLRNPYQFDPFLFPDASRARRNQVLQNLVDVGKLSQAQASKYEALPIQLATEKPPVVKEGCANAPRTIRNVGFFCDYVVNWLESTGGISDSQLTTGGLKIVTTLDVKTQNTVQQNLATTIPPSSPMTAIMPVVDPHTGDVLAMATSKAYGNPTSRKDSSHTVLPIFTSYTGFGASTYKLFPLLTALSTGIPGDWPLQNQDPYHPGCYTADPAGVQNGDAQETYDANETLASATAKSSNTYFVSLVDQILSCNLQPIVDLAENLGMKALEQSSDIKHQTVGQTVVDQQRSQQLVLGSVSTSPLELAGAYAAIANDGKFNTPAPVLSIMTDNGQNLSLNRPVGKQVVSPQVARQAVQILTGDTKSPGTSAGPFGSWYAQNPSIIAGKTGTAQASPKQSENATIWFVGMTPNLVAATELVDLDSPFAPSRGLPGESGPGTAYGDYASGVWLKALQPLLAKRSWTWPDPDSVPGNGVPDLTGQSLTDAAATLKDAGYKMAEFDKGTLSGCPSTVASGDVAYYAPQIAPAGATITVCPSSGVSQPIYHAPPPPPPTNTHRGGNGNTHGGGNSQGGNQNGRNQGGGNQGGGNQGGGQGGGSGGPGRGGGNGPGPGGR